MGWYTQQAPINQDQKSFGFYALTWAVPHYNTPTHTHIACLLSITSVSPVSCRIPYIYCCCFSHCLLLTDILSKGLPMPSMITHTWNPTTEEAKARKWPTCTSLYIRPLWATEWPPMEKDLWIGWYRHVIPHLVAGGSMIRSSRSSLDPWIHIDLKDIMD